MTTIFAPATPPGRSGVAVLRISGPETRQAFAALGVSALPVPRLATLATLVHSSGETIDAALLLWFPAPQSFTGEDVLEIHTHGSRAVMQELLETLGPLPGFRLAEPGEFARRAFYNGKMDLTQAEGIADLIEAETVAQKRQALRQMQGELKRVCEGLRERIIRARAFLEAHIDFSDAEIPVEALAKSNAEIEALLEEIEALLADERRGERLREGAYAVILGAPNAGKSTLLNALARRDVAIVSATPGTTRDILEVHLDLGGYPLTLTDTAGIRETAEEVESEGIRRALARAEHADFRLVVLDASQPEKDQKAILSMIQPDDVVILNKMDQEPQYIVGTTPGIPISALRGTGLDLLIFKLKSRMEALFHTGGGASITRARHRICLTQAAEHIKKSRQQAALELKAEELRLASEALGRITGSVRLDDILDMVFSSFCIGK